MNTNNKKEEISIIIADYKGTIHAFNQITPSLFQTDLNALRGKNFFHMMSNYSRKYVYETFGSNVFKTFKVTSRTIRYSLPHVDDVNYENFKVVTSKCVLVKPKVKSPLNTDPYMIKIMSRASSDENRKKLFKMYTDARNELRKSQYEIDSRFMRDTSSTIPCTHSLHNYN